MHRRGTREKNFLLRMLALVEHENSVILYYREKIRRKILNNLNILKLLTRKFVIQCSLEVYEFNEQVKKLKLQVVYDESQSILNLRRDAEETGVN